MKISSKIVIFLVIPLLLLPAAITYAQQTTIGAAQNSIYTAYNTLIGAYDSGADVGKLIDRLNQAINLTSQAQALNSSNPQQAQTLATQAQAIAQNVTAQALATMNATNLVIAPVIAAIIAAAFVAVGCLIYLFGPKLFWRTWLKLRKNYLVKAKNGTSKFKGLAISAEQVCAVILGITIIIALVATVPFLLPKNAGEQFSELGILGPNMQLGDYPSTVVAGQPVSLFVYVGNQMGQPTYYDVMVKLGNNNTATDPAPVTSISQYSSILPNNGTWTFPVYVTITQPGLNQRIIFELWTYNQTLNQMQYNNRWGQVWLNVTAPAS
jgi:uncharacterized membrane protein